MQETTKHRIHRFIKLRTQQRRAYAIFTALAILVSLSTTCLLIRPASTMTTEVLCGLEEHTHTEACFARILVCDLMEDLPPSGDGTQQEAAPDPGPPPSGEALPGEALPPAGTQSPAEGAEPADPEPSPETAAPEEETTPGTDVPVPEEPLPNEDPPLPETDRSIEEIPPEQETIPDPPIPAEPEPAPSEEVPSPEEGSSAEETPPEQEDSSVEAPSDAGAVPLVGLAALNPAQGKPDSEREAFAAANCAQPGGMLSHLLVFHSPAEENRPLYAAVDPNDGEAPASDDPAPTEGESGSTDSAEADSGVPQVNEAFQGEARPPEDSSEPGSEDSHLPDNTTEVPDTGDSPKENDGTSGGETHVHTEGCYEQVLLCGKEAHTHGDNCYVRQGTLMMALPEGAAVPEGYETQYRYIDPENRFGVLVHAPTQALPEDAVLVAELLEEDSHAYAAAQEALESIAAQSPEENPFTYDGFVALDIRFLQKGQEIEPSLPVYVCIHAAGLLPENTDPDSVAVQHHARETRSPPGAPPIETEVRVDVVADHTAQTGALETADNPGAGTVDIMAAFEVESFSTFTATYSLRQLPLEVVPTVEGNSAIDFQLFNYSKYINKTAQTDTADGWRDISRYFQFRGEEGATGTQVRADLPDGNRDNTHDEDGFTKRHATVERRLDEDGYPVLDLTRYADGTARTDGSGNALSSDTLLTASQRSMAYLFQSGDHAVTAYSPSNTILQYDPASGTYRYDSRENAVDYDGQENRFLVRNYVERNDSTAGFDLGSDPYFDFLPFNHTGGVELGTHSDTGNPYHLTAADVDYWFGMRMDVDFYQVKDGQYKGSDMIFHFSGDDDVWVFLDGVLVLDLGGTHGAVTGSINFATGEVEQYLDWNGTTAEEGDDQYFSTTIQACFDAAGATPNNGWKNYDAQANSGIFADYTPHTLSFFYLERGSSVANCMIDFNLPTVPEQSLTVTKEVEDPGGAIADDTLYTFRILQENGEPFVTQGDTYTLLENDVAQGSRTVTAQDGSFQLTAGQSAQFERMLQFQPGVTTYYVEELLPNGEKACYRTVAWQTGEGSGSYEAGTEGVAGETETSYPTPVLSAEATQMVFFTNTAKTGDLILRKVVHRTDGMEAVPQAFTFGITGPTGTYLTSTGEPIVLSEDTATQVSITADTPLTIHGLPAGADICVAETDCDGFAVRWEHDNATQDPSDDVEVLGTAISGVPIGLGSTTTLTCTNTTGPVLPSTGGGGSAGYTTAGVLLMLGAGVLFVQRRKKGGSQT